MGDNQMVIKLHTDYTEADMFKIDVAVSELVYYQRKRWWDVYKKQNNMVK